MEKIRYLLSKYDVVFSSFSDHVNLLQCYGVNSHYMYITCSYPIISL
jgi:hypothetical protein